MFKALGIVILFVSQASAQGALTLAQAEDLLIERNLTVLAAKYQVDANRAARLIASYKLNPIVTVGAEQIPFYSPVPGSYPRFFTTNPDAGANPVYTLRIDQIHERGGKRELRTTAADEQLKASEAQMLDAIRTQLFRLRQAFTAATLARENIRLAEETQRQYTRTLTLTEAKVEEGDIPRVDLYRVGAGRLQYEQATLQSRTAYDAAVQDVINTLGDPLRTTPLEIVADFENRKMTLSLNELRSIALAERPDVLAARHLLASAESNMQLAFAQRKRDVDIGYEYQRVGNDHTAGVVLQVPLFVHNDQTALYSQAEAQKRAAEAQLKQTELQALVDVDKAYQSYLSARRVLDLYNDENLGHLERLRTVANVSYQEGASSLFELLDAQRAYNGAMTAYNQARADYQMTLWDLEQATGHSLRQQ